MNYNLRSSVLFSHLDERQFRVAEGLAREIKLQDGQLFFQAGDPATRFFLVLQGQIKLSRLSLQGQEKVIEIIPAGETFAEALMFGEQPAYPVNATAIGETRLLSFDNSAYLELLRGSTETCFRLMADMSARLKHLISEIEILSLQNASYRLASYLWKRWDKTRPADGCIELQVPKGVIASRLSITPETLSRTLHGFSQQGLIRVEGSRVEILDPEGLHAIADPLEAGG
ncbi:MAG: Crp/Fnr family transcriptional regulator [Candidatus Thiodiazotropha sp.]